MDAPLTQSLTLAPPHAAAQHGPRPLPLFLDLVASQTEGDPERRAAVLAGLKAYQQAERMPRPPAMPVVARAGRAVLRDYGGAGPPAVFVPSLINPPFILDLSETNSLLRWLSGQGVRPMLVDWGEPNPPLALPGKGDQPQAGGGAEGAARSETLRSAPGPSTAVPAVSLPCEAGEDVFCHVSAMLLPLLAALNEPVHLIGYCLGGTMALAAAMQARLLSLTLIAAPWHFTGFGEQARTEIGSLWRAAQPAAERMGLVPMEVLQTGFWRLDPARTVAKYEAFGRMDPDSETARTFVALEDWANAGAPLTYAAGRELFEGMVGADVTGRGAWRGVDPRRLRVPTLEFVSLHDRIVPAASSPRLADQRLLGLGHVGMIVGGRAQEQLWEPLAQMLSQPQQKG